MANPFLPATIDNTYLGQKVALWILGLLLLMKGAMSVNSMLNGYLVATGADGLPLDSYPPAAARTIVSLFAMWGLGHLMICLLCVLVLVRYRRLVPFMFALLLVEHLGRRLIRQLIPIVTTGAPPAHLINILLVALLVAGLALSLWKRGDPRRPAFSEVTR